ncbi:PTR2-domain-containing protein [Neoconidiobolus thromboides FSU 785]|nr:PTR2-domain-containing protein [Neoconidiobolus thromboides FSU 785]
MSKNETFESELTERERILLEQERVLNAELDVKLEANHDKFPKAIYFIVPNELCERFCYYGIKNLLNKYLQTAYGYPEYYAKAQVSLFNALVYLFPFVGAAISDSFLGKYHTIVYMSFIYLIGNALLATFSINGLVGEFGSYPFWSYIVPSLLIAIGAGGIKPCVSSHGGDQFLPTQAPLLDKFFSLFYVCINVGALVSQYLTPYLKDYTYCFGSSCYFLALGIPTIAFAVALALFIFGFRYYRVVPPTGRFMPWVALKTAIVAGYRNFKASKEEKAAKKHWLEFADDLYGKGMVEETRLFIKVMIMLLPLSFFWLLYDQNNTEWQNNYDMMNQKFLWFIPLPTEASSNVNSILIIIFVPLMSYFFYPFLEKRGIKMPLLTRMVWGWLIMILTFILSTSLQYYVEANSGSQIKEGTKIISCNQCINGTIQLPQYILLSLGEAMVSPVGLQFAYTQVGKQMKSSSSSIFLITSAIGNYCVLGLEIGLKNIASTTKMWIYVAISTFFYVIFVIMAKYWYVSKEEEEATFEVEKELEVIKQ